MRPAELPLPLIKSAIRGLRSLRSDKVATPPCAAKAAIPCVPAAKRNPLCDFPFSSGFIEALTQTVCGWSFFIL
ncbi:hypothetical protein DW964_05040 [Ruminococcus sp. AM47-2BH]|nr:hypothetical protein DW964_05040 [Ruminococcus sp. AM47-2BH]